MDFLERVSAFLNHLLVWIGGFFLLAMIALTCANILLRIVWVPISGTFELMGFFGAVAAVFALSYTQLKRGHIAVDILIHTFSEGTRRFLTLFNNIICMFFFAFVAWQITDWATTIWRSGEVTETLRIAYYPFTYAVALGFAILSLVFLTDTLKSLFSGKERK
jgi:TRAP-type C4-dicarboxylate transport system permease small subunit